MEKDIRIKLKDMVHSSGCNAKLPPGDLRAVLENIPHYSDEKLIGGYEKNDDALVYDLGDGSVLLETVDFFPPMVDDGYTFGEIAAANAISDIYAMGAEPMVAMSLMCFPSCLPLSVMEEIMRGAIEKAKEAGIRIAGGHTISDRDPKFGLSVTARIEKEKVWTNGGCEENDALVLTKKLGVGVLMTSFKAGEAGEEDVGKAIESMRTLNKKAMESARDLSVHAATDVTGFSLLGHSSEMAEASGKSIVIDSSALQFLDGAYELASEGFLPEGRYTNEDYIGEKVSFSENIPLPLKDLLFSPETSGGLLLSLSGSDAKKYIERMEGKAFIIGKVVGKMEKDILVI